MVELPPVEEKGWLQLAVNPTDSTIVIAGQPEITEPGTYELLTGSYTIQVSKEGYYPKTVSCYIASNQTTAASITLPEKPDEPPPEPEQATLVIMSTPTGA